MKSTAILIPARYGSTRFPGKPLTLLDGIPMIQRVFNTCWNAGFYTYVLTDDQRIADLIPSQYCYIDKEDYENGTERCAGAVLSRKFEEYDQFINVQGDMPDVTPDMLLKAVLCLQSYDIGTVYTDMPKEMQNDPNTVKMIKNSNNSALWFGRGFTGYGDWHLGVYSYTKTALKSYLDLREYPEEKIERLEQLRWLKNGWQIGCYHVDFNGLEINTPEDAERWNR
jgi:3-deoxy-manno-octulosonate cytidylyltransferase (CMP-KDO synthetase)